MPMHIRKTEDSPDVTLCGLSAPSFIIATDSRLSDCEECLKAADYPTDDRPQKFEMSITEQAFYATYVPRCEIVQVRPDMYIYINRDGRVYARTESSRWFQTAETAAAPETFEQRVAKMSDSTLLEEYLDSALQEYSGDQTACLGAEIMRRMAEGR